MEPHATLWVDIIKVSFQVFTVGGIAVLMFQAGIWKQKLDGLYKALNGDGPWQRKIDSTKRHTDEVAEAFLAWKEQHAQTHSDQREMCATRAGEIERIHDSVVRIEANQARKNKGE